MNPSPKKSYLLLAPDGPQSLEARSVAQAVRLARTDRWTPVGIVLATANVEHVAPAPFAPFLIAIGHPAKPKGAAPR